MFPWPSKRPLPSTSTKLILMINFTIDRLKQVSFISSILVTSDRTPVNGTYLLRRPPSGRWKDAAWEAGPDLRTGRADHTCSLVRSTGAAASRRVVIVGGQMREGGITDTVELYDVSSNELSQGERWEAKA